MPHTRNALYTSALVLLAPLSASAHTFATSTQGFWFGLLHPISGIDHLIVMLGVGVWAAQLGGKKRIVVPCAFITMMLIGGIASMLGIAMPVTEIAITASVVATALLVLTRLRLHVLPAALLVGLMAFFHGHAHGAEIPSAVSGMQYAIGFALSTAALHVVGIVIAECVSIVQHRYQSVTAK